ncbi:hypothetical protein DRE_03934 [Drechslerella stenobrocha 248]|uniref:MOSC domain-containing protein n=1 Tax=Drechslerella stenobrocha 248 TaxID=1043628 RepID=W7I3E9_9PEZI|nr:hypothetical protein DRE_03934 [Drechslerella stenobrocha 248]
MHYNVITVHSDLLYVYKLFVYPVKSLRGCSVSSATLTAQGLAYDRKYMLVRVRPAPTTGNDASDGGELKLPDPPGASYVYESLYVGNVDALCLFSTCLQPTDEAPEIIKVTYNHPTSRVANGGGDNAGDVAVEGPSVEIPIAAAFGELEKLEVNLHESRCVGYDMGDEYEAFFTEWLGFPTKLVYIGDSTREVLGNVAPNRVHVTRESTTPGGAWWWPFPSLFNLLAAYLTAWWWASNDTTDTLGEKEEYRIHFSDCAPLLVTSQTSLVELNAGRRPEDKQEVPLDITKMRPNVVVAPTTAGEVTAFEEDYWSELAVRDGQGHRDDVQRILLTANCGRCKSLNVDYATGKQVPIGQQMLKRLADLKRKVDPGHGYAPIFGRYGFIGRDSLGGTVRVGDVVDIAKRNDERTVFFWPSLSAGTKLKK